MDSPEAFTAPGDFLRSRRARLTPADVGLVSYGARRVPGLRREELAQLAGVSVTYYTRLEQGHSANASTSVIDSISRALRLTDDEHAHLHNLAKPVPAKRRRTTRPDHARAGLVQLIGAMDTVPAVILGRRNEVLAWNRLGHLLLAGHCDVDAPARPADRPNLIRMLFLDPHTRELYPRRQEEGRRAIAALRLIAGRHPDDTALAELIGELSMKSAEFAELWCEHPVHNCMTGTKQFQHPELGALALQFEALHLPDDSGQRLMTYTAAPGSPSEAALALMGSLAGAFAADEQLSGG